MRVERVIEGLPLEEYLAIEAEKVQHIAVPTVFTWIVSPTVIYGKHQIREQEVNEAYCEAHDIRVVQRQSGGGCVYADRGNLMVSFISPSTHSQEVFETFLRMLAGALNNLGYPAVSTAHNDVMVGDRKVAGTACYTTPTGTVVHASMLYDVDMEALEQAITPSVEKLEKHAVASVRQRVRNLRETKDLGDINVFKEMMEREIEKAERLVIFDLDGTLLNTIDDLGYACNHALAACGFPTHAIEEYPRLVGNGVRKLIERALRAGGVEPDEKITDQVMEEFVPYYNAHNCDFTRPYEGIPDLLAALKAKGCKLAVASNKYQAATEKIVSHFFPGVFDAVLGERENIPRKPDPQIVRDIMETLCPSNMIHRPSVLYLGDSLVDKATAENAGVPFVACSWGFVAREALEEAKCEHIIDAPQDMLPFLQ